jgi:hypothetical protein
MAFIASIRQLFYPAEFRIAPPGLPLSFYSILERYFVSGEEADSSETQEIRQQPTEFQKPETSIARWRFEAVEAASRVLARDGNYLEAERRLRDWMGRHGATAPLVDILARITVQQGKLEEAKQLWQTAARIDPENPVHRVALRKLNIVEMRSVRTPVLSPVLTAIIVAIAAIVVALLVFIVYSRMHKHHPKRSVAFIESTLPTQSPRDAYAATV